MIPARRGPLRVAMVSANAVPTLGGSQTHIHEVATRLAAAGVQVTVLTTDMSRVLPVNDRLSGYLVRRWSAYPRSRDHYLAPGLARHLLRSADYRLVRSKGHHRVLGALPAILDRAPGARLVIVGSRLDEQPRRATATRLGISDRVSMCFFDLERRAAVGKLTANADVFCLLSQYEAQAMPCWKRSAWAPSRSCRISLRFPS